MARGIPLLSTWTGGESRLDDFDHVGGRPAELLSCHNKNPRLSVRKFGDVVTARVRAAAKAAAVTVTSYNRSTQGVIKHD